MEAFLTRIQEDDDDWGGNDIGATGAYRGHGGRAGPGDRTARAGAGPNRDAALQFEPQHLPKGANRHNQLSNQYHQRLDQSMSSMFKTHKMSTQDFTLSQDYSHDRTRPPQPLPWDDEDAGEGDRDRDLAGYRQQQSQSVWTSLFNAFKDLFNMNYSQTTSKEEEQAQLREMRRCPSQARNSIHRGIERGAGSGPAARDPGSPSAGVVGSGVKGRVSILQNAQLELTRVNRDNNRDRTDRNQPGVAFQASSISNFPTSFADRNRNNVNQTQDSIRDFKRAPDAGSFHRQAQGANLGKSFSHAPQREPDVDYDDHFARLVTTHQCVNAETN